MDRVVRWRLRNERRLVEDPVGARRFAILSMLVFLGVFGCFVIVQWADPGPLVALCSAIIGGYLGWNALGTYGRAMAYRSGWLDGRTRMVSGLIEAMNRGMTLNDWLIAERDLQDHVLGLRDDDDPGA